MKGFGVHTNMWTMSREAEGAGPGIRAGRHRPGYAHLSGSGRDTWGQGGCDPDKMVASRAVVGFSGRLVMECFIDMPPEIAHGLSVRRPVADKAEQVVRHGLPFPRGKAAQYKLI